MEEVQIYLPGDRICGVEEHKSGSNTFVRGDSIYSAVLGTLQLDAGSNTVSIVSAKRTNNTVHTLRIGDVVTGRVTKIQTQHAQVSIICVGDTPLAEPFEGVVRRQDALGAENAEPDMALLFRPNDIVRCEVISLGDARSFFLSTAKPELGVVYAESVAGVPMVPVSWDRMVCPKTRVVEKRKVAKVDTD